MDGIGGAGGDEVFEDWYRREHARLLALLTVVVGCADLILADLPPDAPMREDVEEIRGASRRASAVTHRLLALARRQVVSPKRMTCRASPDGRCRSSSRRSRR